MKPHHLPLAAALLAGCVAGAQAQATIDQNKALAGNVTPGDTPGFPVTLSLPGSYRLTGNLTEPDADTTAILITSPNVTLDLGGYAILGPCTTTSPCGAGTGDGIVLQLPNPSAPSRTAVSITNGTVRGMGRYGIYSYSEWLRIDNLQLLLNRQVGANLISGGSVSRSYVAYNGQYGLQGNSLVLRDNEIRHNAIQGLMVNITSTGSGNVLQSNGYDGPSGMRSLGPNYCGANLCS